MTKHERFRYEMFLRVRNFGTAHHELFPESSVGGEAFAAVGQSAVAIEAHTTDKLAAAAAVRQVRGRARAAMRAQMKVITRTARGMALTDDSIAKKFQMPERSSDVALVRTARWFIDEAAPLQPKFVRLGLPPTFITDLRDLVDAFDAVTESRQAGRAGRAAAQAGLVAAIDRGVQAIRTLDVVVANTLRDDPMRLAAWKTARRLEGVGRAATDGRKTAAATQPSNESLTKAS